MRWSEAGYLSRIVLTHAPRQASVSLILIVRQKSEIMLSDLIGEIVCRLIKSDTDIRENGIFREPERSKRAQWIIALTVIFIIAGCIYVGIRCGI